MFIDRQTYGDRKSTYTWGDSEVNSSFLSMSSCSDRHEWCRARKCKHFAAL